MTRLLALSFLAFDLDLLAFSFKLLTIRPFSIPYIFKGNITMINDKGYIKCLIKEFMLNVFLKNISFKLDTKTYVLYQTLFTKSLKTNCMFSFLFRKKS